jgi:hypothetical protein
MNNLSEAQLAAALAISVSHIRRFRRRADRADAQVTNRRRTAYSRRATCASIPTRRRIPAPTTAAALPLGC